MSDIILQKRKFSIKDFFSKCDQIWSNLLKKSLMENFIFYAVLLPGQTVVDVILQLTCYNALHLGEWAAKIQIFGVT